ncbi:MAG: rhodanese-like domain-containing protein [Actinobacteria bacterium]|nr:rhodanese-like domain-containing protein [Actinomycetota bacterium]
MIPIFVGELLGTLTPGFMKQPAKYCHVLRDELIARKPSYDRHLGKIPVQVLSPLRPMVNGFFRPVRRGETKGRFDVMPKEIDRDGLRRLLAIGAQLVEVLPPEEYAEDHLPGAINLPLRRLEKEGREVLDPGRPVVVYCWDSA